MGDGRGATVCGRGVERDHTLSHACGSSSVVVVVCRRLSSVIRGYVRSTRNVAGRRLGVGKTRIVFSEESRVARWRASR